MGNKSLKLKLVVESNGKEVTYGRLPNRLTKGWADMVFYFETHDCYNAELHESVVKPIIDRLCDENEDHYVSWVQTKIEALIWEEDQQTTIVYIGIRDSY